MEELFEIPLPEDILIREMKELISSKLKEEKKIDISPQHMRIRELNGKSPGKVYPDNYTFKHISTTIYSGKPLSISNLGYDEPVKFDKQVVPFAVRFYPSKYEFGPKEEYVLSDEITCDEFKKMLQEKYGIKIVGLAKVTYGPPNLLDAPELDWDRKAYGDKIATLYNSPFYLRDGDYILYRDNEEPLKPLDKEEKEKLQKAQSNKRGGYHVKEKALQINT